MLKNHMKSIKGMSIACIVLAALGVLCMLMLAIVIAVLGPYAVDAAYTYTPSMYDYGYSNGYLYDLDDIYGFSPDPYGLSASSVSSAAVAAALGAVVFAFVFIAILNVVCLIAGIIALRGYADPAQYGKIFGWSIAGAICGGLGGGVALLALFIIIAVFSNKDKKLYQQGYYTDASGYFYQPAPGYAQPATQVPAQPASTPAPVPMPAPAPLTGEAPMVTQPTAPIETQPAAPVAEPATQPAASVETQPAAPAAAEPATQPPATEFQVVETDTIATLDDGTVVEVEEIDVIPVDENPEQPQS